MPRVKFLGFTSFENVDHARKKLLDSFIPSIESEEIPSLSSTGRVTAEEIMAPYDFPPYNRSAVDGYAVRAEDTFGASENSPITLEIVGEIEAGDKHSLHIKSGEAAIIYTGGALPEGANAVVPFEHGIRRGKYVDILKPVHPQKNVSLRGEDFRKGEVLIPSGTLIRPWHVAALIQAMIKRVKVYKKLKIGIINTGSELIDIDKDRVSKEGIPNSAGPLISSYVSELGAEPIYYGVVGDSLQEISSAISEALAQCDIVVITGGTSVGGKDLVPDVLSRMEGSAKIFHGVNLRPGRTAGAYVVKGKPVIMISGLPVACLVGMENFLKPLILKAYRMKEMPRPKIRGLLTRRVANAVGFRSYYRVAVFRENDKIYVEPLRLTGSGILSTLLKGNGLLIIDESLEGVEEGTEIEVELLGPIYPEKPSFLNKG